MVWTIVGALVFVFFIAPLIFQLVVGLIGALFDGSETVGCIGLVVVLLILLAIIF